MGVGTWVLHLDYNAPCTGKVGVEVKNKEDGTLLARKYNTALSSGTGSIDVSIDDGCSSVDFNTGEHLMMRRRGVVRL
jgi:hypothetical protein